MPEEGTSTEETAVGAPAEAEGADWIQSVEGAAEGAHAEVEEWLAEHVVGEEPRLQPPPNTPERYLSILAQAREALDNEDFDTAVKNYSRLVKSGKLLEIVIADLETALVRHPVNVDLFMTLGDAYLKNDQLAEAMDAYNKAEALLR